MSCVWPLVEFCSTTGVKLDEGLPFLGALLKREQDLGTLAPGRFADIIAVRGDVLHDIELLQHIDVVIKGGVRVK